ncbi:hypothetical protein IAT40_001731 [Kwoniella sp. CBS 6097]
MKASYIATILLSATLTLAAPAKLDDVLVSSDTIAALASQNQAQGQTIPLNPTTGSGAGSSSIPNLNNIGSIVASGSSSGLTPNFPVSMPGLPIGGQSQPQPARPAEYVSGALRQHNPQVRALGDPSSLPIVGDMGRSASNSVSGDQSSQKQLPKADGLVEILKNPMNGKNTAKPLEMINDGAMPATDVVSDVLGHARNGKKRLARRETVELGADHLGRMIVKRGNEFMIQEPSDQGRQWEGADELDDENDEPFWG